MRGFRVGDRDKSPTLRVAARTRLAWLSDTNPTAFDIDKADVRRVGNQQDLASGELARVAACLSLGSRVALSMAKIEVGSHMEANSGSVEMRSIQGPMETLPETNRGGIASFDIAVGDLLLPWGMVRFRHLSRIRDDELAS